MIIGLVQFFGNFGGVDMVSFGDVFFINNSNVYMEEIVIIFNNSMIRDVVIFWINFVFIGDIFMFCYVFVFDEYFNFVCSNFNDVFGFFLEGIDLEMGIFVICNFVQILGMEFLVFINSINNGVLGGYFGSYLVWCFEEFNGLFDYVNLFNQVLFFVVFSYNGFIDVFLAKVDVVFCQEY